MKPEEERESDGEPPSAIEPGRVSALLQELAHAPPQDPATWERAFAPGVRVGRFELLRVIGRGGFGVVLEARDAELGRLVAFKAIRPGTAAAARVREERLLREAEAAAQLNHPNIVTLYDLGRSPAGPYLVLELLDGETLADRLRRGPLPVDEALHAAIAVARALAHAHGKGVLHRDLKPENVFLCGDGAAKVFDFGLAHLFGAGPGGGTPAYMAPEQWRGEPEDERTDLFGAAAMLHETLAGRPPYSVAEGRSAALDRGAPPVIAARGVPRALARLVASGLQRDPARRPRNAQVWLDGLLEAARRVSRAGSRRRRLRRLALLAAAVIAVAAGVVALWDRWVEGPAGERISVAVADFANETGERDLDGLSGMLITSLEQSRRLAVLTRSRMFDVLRQLGREDARRIDEPLAREVGRRTRTRALLLGGIRRFDGLYAVELKALDPVADEYLFGFREQARGKDRIPELIDRISERARRALRDSRGDIWRSQGIERIITPNLDAYHQYFSGLDCLEHPSRSSAWPGRDCAPLFRGAIALDPQFVLAHYQLARALDVPEAAPSPEERKAIAQAMELASRAPPKERALVRALAARLDGRADEALATYDEVLERYPDDKDALFQAGDLLHHRDEYARAAPYLERLLALDPTSEWALDHLSFDLGAAGRRDALGAHAARWRAMPQSVPVLHAIAQADIWLGDAAAAERAAQRAIASGGGTDAHRDLFRARMVAGDFAGAEAVMRPAVDPGAPLQPTAYVSLASALASQGRRAEGLRVVDALGARIPERERAPYHFLRGVYLAGDGAAEPVLREASATAALDPGMAANLSLPLALVGDLDGAARLAAALRAGTDVHDLYRAVVAWRRGDAAGAEKVLRAVEARMPLPREGMAPSYLLGELYAATGRDADAVAAFGRFQALWPTGMWRSWAYPRSVYLTAAARARLGDRAGARRDLDRLLATWKRADPGLPLLRDARALRARVASGRP